MTGVLSGCINPGKVTGGGQLIDDSGNRADFGLNGNTCGGDIDNPRGHFNYIDQTNGVKMNGDLTASGVCVSQDQWQEEWYKDDCLNGSYYFNGIYHEGHRPFDVPVYLLYANYRSTNPQKPGAGNVRVYVKDNGEGQKADGSDQMDVYVYDGPFAGYHQQGTVQGNIQVLPCDETNG